MMGKGYIKTFFSRLIFKVTLFSDDDNVQKKKGRTFDEIREENRSKQLHPKRSNEREKEYEGSKAQQTPKREGTSGGGCGLSLASFP